MFNIFLKDIYVFCVYKVTCYLIVDKTKVLAAVVLYINVATMSFLMFMPLFMF